MNEGDLAALLRQHASRQSVPGAAIGVLREGATTTAYHGVADESAGVPVTAETLFSVGSLTKPMVDDVIAGLAEAGRLALDDPVAAHVPELRGRGWAHRATLRDLLANRSGLALSAGLEFDFAGREEEDAGALSRLAAGPGRDIRVGGVNEEGPLGDVRRVRRSGPAAGALPHAVGASTARGMSALVGVGGARTYERASP